MAKMQLVLTNLDDVRSYLFRKQQLQFPPSRCETIVLYSWLTLVLKNLVFCLLVWTLDGAET